LIHEQPNLVRALVADWLMRVREASDDKT